MILFMSVLILRSGSGSYYRPSAVLWRVLCLQECVVGSEEVVGVTEVAVVVVVDLVVVVAAVALVEAEAVEHLIPMGNWLALFVYIR